MKKTRPYFAKKRVLPHNSGSTEIPNCIGLKSNILVRSHLAIYLLELQDIHVNSGSRGSLREPRPEWLANDAESGERPRLPDSPVPTFSNMEIR